MTFDICSYYFDVSASLSKNLSFRTKPYFLFLFYSSLMSHHYIECWDYYYCSSCSPCSYYYVTFLPHTTQTESWVYDPYCKLDVWLIRLIRPIRLIRLIRSIRPIIPIKLIRPIRPPTRQIRPWNRPKRPPIR